MKFDERLKDYDGFGLIQVITGNGKGKTTSALGLGIRAYGAGKKVAFIYFDKGGNSHYSERKTLEQLNIPFTATGRDRIDQKTGVFDFSKNQQDIDEAQKGLEAAKLFSKQVDLLILDEINSTVDLGFLKVEDVLEFLKEKPRNCEIVLTGRDVPKEFCEIAHLVSEVQLQKHYFYSGVKAREGIDY